LSASVLNTIIALVVLAGLARILYRRKVQESATYKATVVPLAGIMDVGFIVFSPVIILLFGYGATWAMLALCTVGILTGFAISYNINNYEPLIGKPDRLHRWNSVALWALIGASVVNEAYRAVLLMTLVFLPLGDLYSPGLVTATAALLLGILAIYAFAKGLMSLNDLANKSTAFNLSAIAAVVVAFGAYNVQQLAGGNFDSPHFAAPADDEALRQLLGLFVLVQGFESSRYIGAYFSAEKRVRTMRSAQYISSAVYVLFVAFSLVLFATVEAPKDVTAIFVVSEEVSVFLPFLIMAAAVGSQLSAIVDDTQTRSEMLVGQVGDRLPRQWTFPLFLVPAILVVLLTDVSSVVALASRVFAAYYLSQALIAGRLAWRAERWAWVAFFGAVALAMAAVAVFGLPT
jgi:hypothetical protein